MSFGSNMKVDTIRVSSTLDGEYKILFLNFSGFCPECMDLEKAQALEECDHVREARVMQDLMLCYEQDVPKLNKDLKLQLINIWRQPKSYEEKMTDLYEFVGQLTE